MTVIGEEGGGYAVKDHVLIIPFPSSGHLIPILDFTAILAGRGLMATVLATPQTLPLISPVLSAHPTSVDALVLPLAPEVARDVALASNPSPIATMRSLGEYHEPLRDWIASHPNPPSVIVSDMFAGWTQRLAEEVGIKRVVFSPSGAMALSVIFSLWQNMPSVSDSVAFPEIPGSPEYAWQHLSGIYRTYREGDPAFEFIKAGFDANMESWGIVINTTRDLEGPYVDHLMKRVLGHDRVWAVGPLLPPEPGSFSRGGSSSVLVDEIVSWLNAREDRSVVYVCFGSVARLTEEQFVELASGLEKSGVHIVWAVRADIPEMVLEGFKNRMLGRVFVINGWAPQLKILNHRAVGAFLTHCGWNSTLEAIASGVPMLAWPMGADQFVNATLIVDQLKVARRVCEGAKTVPDSNGMARAIAELIEEDRPERARATQLRKSTLAALEDGVCWSNKDIGKFVECLRMLSFHNLIT